MEGRREDLKRCAARLGRGLRSGEVLVFDIARRANQAYRWSSQVAVSTDVRNHPTTRGVEGERGSDSRAGQGGVERGAPCSWRAVAVGWEGRGETHSSQKSGMLMHISYAYSYSYYFCSSSAASFYTYIYIQI